MYYPFVIGICVRLKDYRAIHTMNAISIACEAALPVPSTHAKEDIVNNFNI